MSTGDTSQDNARSLHDEGVVYAEPHQVIKNYALEVCQLLFYEGNKIGFTWDRDQERTQITIVDKHAFNMDQVNFQPAIVANRGPQAWMRTSGFRQMQSEDPRTGERTYTDLIRGSVTLSCFSKQGLEAESIAGYLFAAFQQLRDVLRKLAGRGRMVPNHLGFFKVEATTMGEEALVKSNSRPDMSVVPVAVAAMVQRRWSVTPKARPLQKIDVRTTHNQNP